jgi:hypothetical protein
MELPRSGDYRFTFHSSSLGESERIRAYVLQIMQPVGEIQPPRLALRYDVPGEFRSKSEAYEEGLKVARRLASGELSPSFVRLKQEFREFTLIGSASFRLDFHQWEPVLELVSHRATNKGARQGFTDVQSPFQRNLFQDAESAAKFAIQYGERMIIGLVGGLTI